MKMIKSVLATIGALSLVFALVLFAQAQNVNDCVGLGMNPALAEVVCGPVTTTSITVSGDSTLGALVVKSTGAIESDATTLGLDAASGANTACSTTCAVADGACLFGFDAGTTALVDCASALADTCVCAEAVS